MKELRSATKKERKFFVNGLFVGYLIGVVVTALVVKMKIF